MFFKDRMVYGTPFEQLEDEEKSAITKRPKGIQDEIVTDERGKRRFHGAFTGGFSAGYFNTVGTKHGWVPQTFKSSREDRADKLNQSAQDFMDEEDLGEFGIATRKLRTKVDFMDSLVAPGEKRLLAWERSSMPSTSQLGDDDSLVHKLTGILRPVNDSIGVRMLKKMGWRPGKGIGQKMTRRALERQKVIDAKSAGKHIDYDEQAVKEVETHVPGAEFAPDDISIFELKQKEDVHGIGYHPLQNTGVLSEKYGTIASTLKTNKRSKGIRGQAFGVGAFEDEDDDIYTNYDLNQYDFEVGATSKAQKDVPKFDSTFVPAQASAHASRKYFTAPQLPSGWRPNPNRIKTMLEKKTPHKIPDILLKATEKLTPFQRAKLLGERDHSVLEMLSSTDREKLRKLGGKNGEKKIEDPKIRRNEAEPFEEEPMKAHRFKKFVAYLKRGIPFPQPVDMTRLEWEKEQTEFQEALSPELRSLLPEIRDRQKPLAKIGFAAPIAEHLKSRFQSETGTEIKNEPNLSSSNDPKVEAVRTKCFGQKTRQKHDWHPAKDLCKRFNVTNPYPDSNVVGTAGLGKISQKDYAAEYSLMDFGGGFRDTASELSKRQHPSRFDQGPANYGAQEKSQKEIKNETLDVQVLNETTAPGKKDDIAPMELLAAIFGNNDEEEEESMQSDDDDHNRVDEFPFIRPSVKKPEVRESNEQQRSNELAMAKRANIVSVLDLIEDDNVYGPAMPTQEYLAGNFVAKEVLTIEDNSDEESSNSSSDENKKKRKDRKRDKKHSRKHHKSKKAKKRKRKKSEDL